MNKDSRKELQLRLQEYEFETPAFAGPACASAHSQIHGRHLINHDATIEPVMAVKIKTAYKH